MKTCKKCNETFALDMFRKTFYKKDNAWYHRNTCNNCIREYQRKLYHDNPTSYRPRQKERSQILRDGLSDNYIKALLCQSNKELSPKDIPQELIQLKRIHLQLYKQLKNHDKTKKI